MNTPSVTSSAHVFASSEVEDCGSSRISLFLMGLICDHLAARKSVIIVTDTPRAFAKFCTVSGQCVVDATTGIDDISRRLNAAIGDGSTEIFVFYHFQRTLKLDGDRIQAQIAAANNRVDVVIHQKAFYN